MALRGDPPKGEESFRMTPGGFRYASELIQFIREKGFDFAIGCGGYPEGHIECPSREVDLTNLKKKVDAGAQFIVTQFFFDNEYFFRFRDALYKNGIRVPLLAGILPISNTDQIMKFSVMCGCTIPARVLRGLYQARSPEKQEEFGLSYAEDQVQRLLLAGVDGVHLYALNKHAAVERLAPLIRG